jgi:glycerol-3-phosphate dehydrogenase (NAD(P)+)
MEQNLRVAVIGGGSFATALVKILCEKEYPITWWMRNTMAIQHIKTHHHNLKYLESVRLDNTKLLLTSDINKAIRENDVLIFAIPSAFLKDALVNLKASLKGKQIITAIKGIVPGENLIVADYFHQFFQIPFDNIGVITGPCHAEEVALERLSFLTAASLQPELREFLVGRLSCNYIKVTPSDDIFGTEYAAVIKNIVAIASGMAHALGYGDNFQAVLVSNSLQELKRFVKSVYPIKRDITDSAYLGDLLVTAYSQFSRNRTLGSMIGKGYSVRSAMLEMNMVAEGYYAVDCIKKMNKLHDVKMPICNTVYKILYEGKSPRKRMKMLAGKLS